MPNNQEEFQKKLQIERQVLVGQLQRMKGQYGDETIDIVALQLEDKVKVKIARVDRALQRIKENAFGKCQTCGKQIDDERLAALPYAEMCIDCQRGLERKTIHQYAYMYA